MLKHQEPMPAPRDLAQEIADRVGFSMEACPYKDRFWRHQWAQLIAAQIQAIKVPMAGQMVCPNCRSTIRMSIHMDEPIPD